jgi:transposase-like protein
VTLTNEKIHKRPKYSLEFKQDAAKLVLEKGYSQPQAADHLGLSLSALGRWVRAERKPSANLIRKILQPRPKRRILMAYSPRRFPSWQ